LTQCEYLVKKCRSGCDNYVCRALFPEKQPLVMKTQLEVCKSDGFEVECPRFDEGNEYQRLKKLMKVGCPFLSNTVCGRPSEFWCKGRTPPFKIESGEKAEVCLKADFKECPYYQDGLAFREEWRRVKGFKAGEKQVNK